jgi:hypothetical protein
MHTSPEPVTARVVAGALQRAEYSPGDRSTTEHLWQRARAVLAEAFPAHAEDLDDFLQLDGVMVLPVVSDRYAADTILRTLRARLQAPGLTAQVVLAVGGCAASLPAMIGGRPLFVVTLPAPPTGGA